MPPADSGAIADAVARILGDAELAGTLSLAMVIAAAYVLIAGILPFQLAGVFARAAEVVTAGF